MQFRSFAASFLFASGACALLVTIRDADSYRFEFHMAQLALVPLGIYIGGLSAVWMHNATHGSFRSPIKNWLAGQIAGIHQLWGFTGWKLIHLVHHMYSDDPVHDTHPPRGRTFWQFARAMAIESSAKISQRYKEHFGDTLQTRMLQRAGAVMMILMGLANLSLMFLLLGPAAFVFFYIPSYIANHLLYVDINYSAHPRDEQGNTAAANLNHTPYYKLANFFWHGIYFHGNHHRKPLLFNPRYMPVSEPRIQSRLNKMAA